MASVGIPILLTAKMDEVLREELNIPGLKCLGAAGGGCINEGVAYDTGQGSKIFVKINSKSEARRMFDGEMASLEAMYNTGVIRVPKPIKVMKKPGGGAMLAMEYLDIGRLSRHSAALGENLAKLHNHNAEAMQQAEKSTGFVGKGQQTACMDKFGFNCVTCCGYLPQDNQWQESWISFYSNKLEFQLNEIEKEYGDREARDLWSQLQIKMSTFFKGLEIKPALMHGDLWGGNAGEIQECPVVFDPASFYGHSEYDLAISTMFGGFSSSFFNAYHKVLPQSLGFRTRNELYQLFHYLNHWNHFGTGYRSSSISIMRKLVE